MRARRESLAVAARVSIVIAAAGAAAGCSAPQGPSLEPSAGRDRLEADWSAVRPAEDPPVAPGPLSLEGALELALASNPELRAARHAADAARARVTIARTFPFNPELTLEARTGRLLTAESEASQSIELSQEFETGGQRSRRVSVAEAEAARAAFEAADRERRLIAEVALAFTQALFASERLALEEDRRALAERLLEIARAREETGDLARLDVNPVRLAAREAAAAGAAAAGEARAARHRLAAAIGRPLPPDLPLAGVLAPEPRRYDGARLLAIALESRPDLRAIGAVQNAAVARVELERASVWPHVRAGIVYEREVSLFETGTGEFGDRDHLLGLSLSIPLPILNRRRGEIAQAIAEARSAAALVEAAARAIERDVRLASTRVETAAAALSLYAGELDPLADEQLRLVQRAFEAGEVGTLEVLRAQEDRLRARDTLLRTRFELSTALAELRAAIGTDPSPAELRP